MKKLIAFFLLLPLGIYAQDYFQQDVAYDIEVALDDENHFLTGHITIDYTNNSSESLPFIWMHLWPNAYKNGKTALSKQQYRSGEMYMFYAMQKNLGYIDSLDFSVDGRAANWEFHPQHIDIAKVNLATPLKPGESISISTPFRVKLPSGKISRLGHIDQSYQITQWYPKPAVFDKDGWHEMPYLNQGEFYSEFGSYDVHLTLPKNYVVGHTGDLVDSPDEERFMNELAKKKIDFKAEGSNEFPASSKEDKTLHFHQENVHDFAWFADKRWIVRKEDFQLPHSGRRVTAWALFTPENKELWERGTEYIIDATHYYSLWNGDYPYNHVTAVDGTISAGGGMEYPNVTVIGNSGSAMGLETVIVHEVGHNWFYGILGSNERINAWMDEGINSFNETRYFETKYQDSLTFVGGALSPNISKALDLDAYSYRYRDQLMYMYSARRADDQPMQCHSDDFTSVNYGTIVYKKTALAFNYLKGYLDGSMGKGTFDRAMQHYFDQWKFKHPNPSDLRASLEEATSANLSWFFEELVQTAGKPNYTAKKVKKTSTGYEVRVKNTGDVPGPFALSGIKDKKVTTEKWYEGIKPGESTKVILTAGELDLIRIDGSEDMVEYDRKDNNLKTKGLLKRVEPLQIRMLTRLEDPNHSQLFWMPVVAWNNQNNWMLGLNLHNASIPQDDWEFSITPLYSFTSNTLKGFGRLSHFRGPFQAHLKTQNFRSFETAQFAQDYYRQSLELAYDFDKRPNSPWRSRLEGELAHVYQHLEYTPTSNESFIYYYDTYRWSPKLTYTIHNSQPRITHDFTVLVRGMFADHQTKYGILQSSLAYEGSFSYNKKDKKLRWRLYGGGNSKASSYYIGGAGITGNTDRMFDHLFLQRQYFDNVANRQVTNTQGAIHMPVFSARWMTTAYVEFEVPWKLPISLFAGGALFDNASNLPSAKDYDYSAGISINIIRDIMAVHVPLIGVQILDANNNGYNPQDFITFELRLEKLNLWKLAREAKLG